ncbi:hypothetical protein FJZ28_04015 [Candidatus Peregrinibacteria bacterium]|nr:hypothetical protein [Candidatus Peregrinibacteria bacterium]
MFSDDEEPWISPTERLIHADPRRAALQREIKAKTGRDSAGKDLDNLKKEFAESKKPTAPKPAEDKQAKVSPRTKTLREKEEDAVSTAQDNPDTDTMIARQEEETKISEEEVQGDAG